VKNASGSVVMSVKKVSSGTAVKYAAVKGQPGSMSAPRSLAPVIKLPQFRLTSSQGSGVVVSQKTGSVLQESWKSPATSASYQAAQTKRFVVELVMPCTLYKPIRWWCILYGCRSIKNFNRD